MFFLQNFAIALFSISVGAKNLLSTHSLASFVIDLSRFNQVGIFFSLNASNSSVSLIFDWWTECCFSQCIIEYHAYPQYTVFNQELRDVIEWVGNLFSLNVTNLCVDCLLMNIERVLFSHIVSRKDLPKTFLVLVWILIEWPYKWRHQFPLDLTVFKARNLLILHCLRSLEYQTQLADLWSGMKVKILFYLLENSRFVLSSTLTFGYAIVCFFFCENL